MSLNIGWTDLTPLFDDLKRDINALPQPHENVTLSIEDIRVFPCEFPKITIVDIKHPDALFYMPFEETLISSFEKELLGKSQWRLSSFSESDNGHDAREKNGQTASFSHSISLSNLHESLRPLKKQSSIVSLNDASFLLRHESPMDCQVEIEVDLDIPCDVRIQVVPSLHYPIQDMISMPIDVNVKNVLFKGKVAVVTIDPSVYITVYDPMSLRLSFETTIGDPEKKRIVKTSSIEALVNEMLMDWIKSRIMYPSYLRLKGE